MSVDSFFGGDTDKYVPKDQGYGGGGGNNYQNNQGGGGYNRGGNNYQNNQGGGGNYNRGGGGNYNRGGGGGYNRGGGGGFKRKPFDPSSFRLYKPITFTGNDNAPDNIIGQALKTAQFLIAKGFTIRVSVQSNFDKALAERLPQDSIELILPWKGFDDKESKFAYNDDTSKYVASMYAKNYENLPLAVQSFLAKNVRMVMGPNAKSYTLATVIWSADGAETIGQLSRDTGNMEHLVNVSLGVSIPVFNVQNDDYELRLREQLGLTDSNAARDLSRRTQDDYDADVPY